MAGWQSGYAAACKAVYAGSIPASASKVWRHLNLKKYNDKNWCLLICPSGGIGRHKGLKIPR